MCEQPDPDALYDAWRDSPASATSVDPADVLDREPTDEPLDDAAIDFGDIDDEWFSKVED